ncbi:MAG: hypothetical protein LBQ97_08490, partial [Fusobacteriaceae bacterium]|nr:hypothetical protein [Fusobacteriaceae bacterium]
MDTNLKRRIEKVLKQNLKRKVAFSLGLVVSYLISGNLLYAGAEGLKANLEELNANLVVREATFETDLQAEIARIKALMAENRQKRAEIWFDYQELIRKGDFYSKPIYPSSQIFFTYGYEHSARNKNRTTSEWQSTIGDISAKLAGVGLPKGKNPYHAGELIAYANGSMQDVGSQAALAWVYGYNTTGTAGGQLMAAYDKNGYNPNITPDSLSGTAAAKYMRPTYVYLDTAKTQPSVLTPPAGAAVVYDSVGNAYLQFTDGSGVLRTVQQGTNIEVATDSAGKVIVSNSLLDPKIGGSNPSTSLMAEAEAKNGDVALGEVVDGRGVYIDDPPHAEAIDVGANIKPLSPTIPDVSKTVTVDVSTPASITLPGMPFTPTQPGSVTPPSSPAVSVTPPDAVGAITVSPPSGVTPNIG